MKDIVLVQKLVETLLNMAVNIFVTFMLCFSGGSGNSQALEQKLFKLQEEVTELHRRRGEVTHY